VDIFQRRDFQNIPDIVLSEDSTAVAIKAITSAHSAIGVMYEHVHEKRPLDAEYAHNLLVMCEHYISDIGKQFQVETDSSFERGQRYAQLRAANERIQQLEVQLGSSVDASTIQGSIKHMSNLISAWWRKFGFGHVRDVHFGAYGCSAEFSCSLFGDFLLIDSPTPISDKEAKNQWFSYLVQSGFVLTKGRRDPDLLDCEVNRSILGKLFSKHMPTAQIQSFENQRTSNGEIVLRNVKLFIRDLKEIASLPVEVSTEMG
jgi:hypothetical protein